MPYVSYRLFHLYHVALETPNAMQTSDILLPERSGSIIILYLFSIISTCYYTPRLECQPCQEVKMSTMYGRSTIISILNLIGLISWPKSHKKRRGRPYVYPPTVILRCFVVRIWLRLDSNRALRDFLAMDFYPYNRRIMKACGLTSLPDRRTFDRRLSTISADIKERIATMASLFVKEKTS